MVLEIHHDRYGHKYYTYPEHSKMFYDYGIRGPQLFYEPYRTRWNYLCYWPAGATSFVPGEYKYRRMAGDNFTKHHMAAAMVQIKISRLLPPIGSPIGSITDLYNELVIAQ